MPRAIIYTRVSTGEQAEHGTSLAEQLSACRKRSDELKAEIIAVYEDSGVSGSLYQARPGIQAALKDLEGGRADTLIIANLSRFSRDREHQSTIKKRVEAAGGRLIFCDMTFEDTPEGDLAFGIMGTFADYERKVIRARTMKGRRRRALEGQQPSRSISPFGYHVVIKADVLSGSFPAEALGTYQVVEEKAQVVRRIYERYAGGASLQSLCRELQNDGIAAPRGGEFWRRCAVHRILQNPVYKGTPAFGRYQARTDESRAADGRKVSYVVTAAEENRVYLEAPALVDPATWAFCQQRLAEGRPLRNGNPNHVHMLSGLLRCPACGKAMAGKWVKRTYKTKQETSEDHFYQCRTAFPSSNSAAKVCHNTSYRAEELEGLTRLAVCTLAAHPALISAALKAYDNRQAAASPVAEAAQAEAELRRLTDQEKATAEAQVAGLMAGASAAAYAGLFRDIARRREEAQARLTQLQRTRPGNDSGEVVTCLADVLADVEEALTAEEVLPSEKRGLLGRIIRAVTPATDVDGEPGVMITLRSPLPSDDDGRLDYKVSMISTFARGTVTTLPSARVASRTRTEAPEPMTVSWGGRPATVASLPK